MGSSAYNPISVDDGEYPAGVISSALDRILVLGCLGMSVILEINKVVLLFD